MAILQLRSNRKATGGRYKSPKVRRVARFGRLPVDTKIGEIRPKSERTIGGNTKSKLLASNKVNVYDAKTKKHVVANIKSETSNPANRHYVRRNILTKGAIVETSAGKAKITSRPGQEGQINGILVE
ncbi:MAG: 30S ribosomal protein S8e [Candidatus Nanoarchaeia archaeon]|jgi:small subunit ribosomal protein S8e|nr:30S ribosomal protein S8e [Candidatus Nanoarchaeia archaeon]